MSARSRALVGLVALALLCPSVAAAQAVHDSTTEDTAFFSASDSFSHNVAVGADRYILITCWLLSPIRSVTAASYAGVSAAFIAGANAADGDRVEVWGLVAPATGSNTVSVTLDDTVVGKCAASSFTGVHQSTPIGTAVGDYYTGSGTSHSHNTTSQTDGLVWDAFILNKDAGTITPDAGQATRAGVTEVGGAANIIATTKAGATTVSTGYAWTNDFYRWGHVTVPLVPAGGGGGGGGVHTITTTGAGR
jgi:hypothetical protein